jgi:hypothetical protein
MSVLPKDKTPAPDSQDTAGNGGESRDRSGDKLVNAIFAAIKKVPASSVDRMRAICRAGHIAEAYSGFYTDNELMEAVFGSTSHDVLKDDVSNGHDAGG